MVFPESQNSAMWVDIAVRKDTIRVFNNHLQTTQIDENDRKFLRTEPLSDTLRNDKAKGIARKLKRNFMKRAEQADSVALRIHDGTPRVIVCGDFNDTPMSYVYRTMARGLRDAFRECGSGYSHTFRGFYNTLRIDYVLSGGFEPLSYEVLPVDYSDHHPVVVRLRKSS